MRQRGSSSCRAVFVSLLAGSSRSSAERRTRFGKSERSQGLLILLFFSLFLSNIVVTVYAIRPRRLIAGHRGGWGAAASEARRIDCDSFITNRKITNL